MTDQAHRLNRRHVLRASAFAGAVGLTGGALTSRSAQAAVVRDSGASDGDGAYRKEDLRNPVTTLCCVQASVRSVDPEQPQHGTRQNLLRMLEHIDAAQAFGGRKDIVVFPAFSLTGYALAWDRAALYRMAIDVLGAETDAIAAKAREHGCYVVFSNYARDPDWPGHVLAVTTIVGPDGRVLDTHWMTRRHDDGHGSGVMRLTTALHDVRDAYVEMYGPEALVPVTRTDVGNIGTASAQLEPALARAVAMNGGEIMLRPAAGSFTPADMQMTAHYNGMLTAVVNHAVSPGHRGYAESGAAGGSTIYDQRGQILAEAASAHEAMVVARLPMQRYRAEHKLPAVATSLYSQVFQG